MKKLFLAFSASVIFFAGWVFVAQAQTKKLWVAPRAGVWRVSAKDDENTNWSGRITLAKRKSGGRTVKYRGYFYWLSQDKETSGREYFRGSFNRTTGKLRLKAYAVKSERGELGIGDYNASVNRKGRNIFRGTWAGTDNVPGKWSAVWLKYTK